MNLPNYLNPITSHAYLERVAQELLRMRPLYKVQKVGIQGCHLDSFEWIKLIDKPNG